MEAIRNKKSFAVIVFLFTLVFGVLRVFAADATATLDGNAFRSEASGANAIIFQHADTLPSGTILDAAGSGSIVGTNSGSVYRVVSKNTIYAPADSSLLFNRFACSSISFDNFNTSEVYNMAAMFSYCSSLSSLDLSGWNTSSVNDLSYMFYGCSKLSDLDVSGWNTSNVTTLESAFCGMGLYTSSPEVHISGLANWDTSNCTTIAHLFMNGADNTGTGKLTNDSLAGVANWNVSNVVNMTSVFYGQGVNLTALDLSRWDVSSVASMNHMFADCRRLESLDLSGWNVQYLETVCNMFDDCYALTTIGDVSHWQTNSLIDISGFLNGCTSFEGTNGTLDLSGWNTSGIKAAQEVFRAIRVSSINLCGWNLSGVNGDAWMGAGVGIHYAYTPDSSSVEQMFLNCSNLQTIATDSSWSLASSVSTRDLFSGCSSLSTADMERVKGAA